MTQAASFTLTEFTGADVELGVEITENAGSLDFTLSLLSSPSGTGDISAFWGHIGDESLIGGLSVASTSGDFLSNFEQSANNVNNLGGGNNLNGGGTPAPLDFGFRIGDTGGGSQIQLTSFTLSHDTEVLDLSLFDSEFFGARIKGISGSPDSSKLSGTFDPPPPSGNTVSATGSGLAFMVIGLGGLGLFRRFARKS